MVADVRLGENYDFKMQLFDGSLTKLCSIAGYHTEKKRPNSEEYEDI